MLNFNDNLKKANLLITGNPAKSKMSVVLAIGLFFVTLFSGCFSKSDKAVKNVRNAAKDPASIIYQLDADTVILVDDIENNPHVSKHYYSSDRFYLYLDPDDKSSNFLDLSKANVILVKTANSYDVATKIAKDMVGEDGEIIYYLDYLEELESAGRTH